MTSSDSAVVKKRPLLALLCMGLSYGLLGWYCSALSPVWNIGSWLIAMGLTFTLIWGWNLVNRFLLLSPRILVTISILSLTVTMAVSFPDLFIVMVMLLASTLFARLELQIAGVNRIWTLIVISVISGAMIGGGWSLGHYIYDNYDPEIEALNPVADGTIWADRLSFSL